MIIERTVVIIKLIHYMYCIIISIIPELGVYYKARPKNVFQVRVAQEGKDVRVTTVTAQLRLLEMLVYSVLENDWHNEGAAVNAALKIAYTGIPSKGVSPFMSKNFIGISINIVLSSIFETFII
jgi:hypothetical protein